MSPGIKRVVVGIPSYNEEDSIGHVVKQVDLGLKRYYPEPNMLPVRRFFINLRSRVSWRHIRKNFLTSKLGRNIDRSGFIIKDCLIYKIRPEKGSGDLMFSLQRK